MSYEEALERGRQLRLAQREAPSTYVDMLEEIAQNQQPPAPRVSFPETLAAFLTREQASAWAVWGPQPKVKHATDPLMRRAAAQPLLSSLMKRTGGWHPSDDPLWKSIPEKDRHFFLAVENPGDLQIEYQNLARMRQAKTALEQSGIGATIAAAVVGAPLDPTSYLEMMIGGGLVKAGSLARKITLAQKVARGAGGAAATGAAIATARELTLSDQAERSTQETVMNVVMEAMFGGVLVGGVTAAGGFVSQANKKLATSAAEEMTHRAEIVQEGMSATPKVMENLRKRKITTPTPDQFNEELLRVLQERPGGFKLERGNSVIGKVVSRPMQWLMKDVFRTPFWHLAMSDFEAARAGAAIYSDIPVAREAVPEKMRVAALDTVKRVITGEISGSVRRMHLIHGGLVGPDKMDRNRFLEIVGIALDQADSAQRASTIAQANLTKAQIQAVEEATKVARVQLDKLHDLGVSTGAWGPKTKLGRTALSYFTRVWDHEKARLAKPDILALVRAWAGTENARVHAFHKAQHTKPGKDELWSEIDIQATAENIGGGRPSLGVSTQEQGIASRAKSPRRFDIPNDFSTTTPDGRKVSINDFLIKNAAVVLDHNANFTLPELLLADRFATTAGRRMAQRRARVEKLTTKLEQKPAPSELTKAYGTLEYERVMHFADETLDLAEMSGRAWDEGELVLYRENAETIAKGRRKAVAKEAELRRLEASIEADTMPTLTQTLRDRAEKLREDLRAARVEREGIRKQMLNFEERALFAALALKQQRKLSRMADYTKPRPWHPQGAADLAEDFRATTTAKTEGAVSRAVSGQRLVNSMLAEKEAKLRKAKPRTPEARLKMEARLQKRFEAARTQLALSHDRFLNIHRSRQTTAGGFMATAEETILELNHARSMGGVVVSSLGDTLGSMFWLGMRDWFAGASKHFSTEIRRLFTGQTRDDLAMIIHGIEVVGANGRFSVQNSLDIPDLRLGSGPVQRARMALRKGSNKLFLLGWWTEQTKRLVATQVQHKMIRLLKKDSLAPKELAFFQRFGVGEEMAARMKGQLSTHGQGGKVAHTTTLYEYARTNRWDDKEAANSWANLVNAVANSSVVTIGTMDLPKAFDMRFVRAFLQFKSFGVAALNRITVASLTVPEAQFVSGMIGLLAMGHLVSELKAQLSGVDTSQQSTRARFMDALERSGLLGTMMDVDAVVTRGTSGTVGLRPWLGAESQNAKYSQNSFADTVFGPLGGAVDDAYNVGRALTRGLDPESEFSQSDASNIRDIIPYQNVFYFRLLLDKIAAPMISPGHHKFEKAAGERLFGLPEKSK